MFKRAVLLATVVLAACVACDDDDDDEGDGSGGPAREGTSAEWTAAWTAAAREDCGGQCVVFSARDGEIPAADAEPANFDMQYDPANDSNSAGWAAVQDFGDAVGCVLPLQPIEPTPINCADG